MLAHHSPARHTSVVGRGHGRHTRHPLHDLKAAFAAVLPTVPEVGGGHGVFGKPRGEGRHPPRRLAEGKVGRAVLGLGVDGAVGGNSKENGGQHIEAVVKGDKMLTAPRDRARLADLLRGVEFREELTLENVPATLEPGLPQAVGQAFELLDVLGEGFGQCAVVVDPGGNEKVVLGALAVAEESVDKKPLDPSVTDAAGVAGQVDPLWKAVDAAQAGLEHRKVVFAELGGLVDGDHVVFLTLITQSVPPRGAVAEIYPAFVWEKDATLGLAVGHKAVKLA